MESYYHFSIDLIINIQRSAPWLIPAMAFFTSRVSELFYMLLFVTIYWCWNSNLGIRLGLLLLISQGFKTSIKLIFHQPRPFWLDPTVQAFNEESSFGIASGHAMDSTVVFGAIAAWIGKTWAWFVAALLILYIGVSRIVIGVHFPMDVVAGWIFGAIILIVYLKLETPAKVFLVKQTTGVQIVYAFLASIGMVLLNVIIVAMLQPYSIPPLWLQNFVKAFPEGEFNPLAITGVYSASGVLFGASLGIILIQKRGGFDAGGVWWQRLIRFIIGIIGLAVFYLGLDFLFDAIGFGGADILGQIFRYLRYALAGLWVIWLAPLTFFALKIGKPLR